MAKKFILQMNNEVEETPETSETPIERVINVPIQLEQPNPTRRRGRQLDSQDIQFRKLRCYEYILYDKLSFTQFRQKVSNEFDITTRMAANIWKEIKTELKEKFNDQAQEILEQQLERTYDLLRRNRENGNVREERETLKLLNSLYNLDKVNLDIQSGGEAISININLTPDTE